MVVVLVVVEVVLVVLMIVMVMADHQSTWLVHQRMVMAHLVVTI